MFEILTYFVDNDTRSSGWSNVSSEREPSQSRYLILMAERLLYSWYIFTIASYTLPSLYYYKKFSISWPAVGFRILLSDILRSMTYSYSYRILKVYNLFSMLSSKLIITSSVKLYILKWREKLRLIYIYSTRLATFPTILTIYGLLMSPSLIVLRIMSYRPV